MNKDEYIRIRYAGIGLSEKISASQNREMIGTSAKLLGMMDNDNTIIMEEEEDVNIIMDFNYYEAIHDNKTGVGIFLETKPRLSDLESEICDAMQRSYTSFFKIREAYPKEGTILIWDLLNNREVLLTDINMSKTVYPGIIFYSRIVNVHGINMTSGIGYAFNKQSDQALIKQYRRELRKVGYPDEKAARFIAAYKMKLMYSGRIGFADI